MRKSAMDESPILDEPKPEVAQLRVWAEKAGHFPEQLPGDRLHPSKHNLKAWIALSVCAQLKLTPDSEITEQTYNDAAAAAAKAEAR
jgi:hypothetical protein